MYKLPAKNLSSILPNILISFHSGCISMDFSFTFQTVPIQCFILKAIQLNCWLQKELQGSKVLHYRSSSSIFWDFQSSHTYLSFLLHAQDSGMPNFTVKPANPSPHAAAEEERERISRHGLKSIPLPGIWMRNLGIWVDLSLACYQQWDIYSATDSIIMCTWKSDSWQSTAVNVLHKWQKFHSMRDLYYMLYMLYTSKCFFFFWYPNLIEIGIFLALPK